MLVENVPRNSRKYKGKLLKIYKKSGSANHGIQTFTKAM